MDHNEFDFLSDLIRPFKEFINKVYGEESKDG
jgi:hypothetical protein